MGEANLIKKVYFPRLIIPMASVVAPLTDFFVSFLVLIVMMGWFGIVPGWNVLYLPVFLLFALIYGTCGGALALTPQRQVSGRRSYDSVLSPILVVCLSGSLPG